MNQNLEKLVRQNLVIGYELTPQTQVVFSVNHKGKTFHSSIDLRLFLRNWEEIVKKEMIDEEKMHTPKMIKDLVKQIERFEKEQKI